MGAFVLPPTFAPPVGPIALGTSGQVLTMVGGRPAFAAGGGGGLPPTPSVDSVLCNGPSFGNTPTWLPLSELLLRAQAIQFGGVGQEVIATGTYNNYTPGTPVDDINNLQVQSITGPVTLTGLIAPVGTSPFGPGGQFLLFQNVGTANNFTLDIANAGSAAANQFAGLGGAVVLPPGASVWLVYNAVASNWSVVT